MKDIFTSLGLFILLAVAIAFPPLLIAAIVVYLYNQYQKESDEKGEQ